MGGNDYLDIVVLIVPSACWVGVGVANVVVAVAVAAAPGSHAADVVVWMIVT